MAYQELVVSANHMVGTYKWIVKKTFGNYYKPVKVYLKSAHIDVEPSHDEDEDGRPVKGVVSVVTKYKVSAGKYFWTVSEDEIYDSEEIAQEVANKENN